MRIKAIAAIGVKGQGFNHELAPFQIFIGRNGAGKTAIAEGVRLGLVGWTAKTGKTAGGVFDRRGQHKEVAVRLTDSEGKMMTRIWSKSGRTVLASVIGEALQVPAVMLDFGTFLNLSTRARTAYLFSLLPESELEVGQESLKEKVRGVRLDPHPEEADAAIATLARIIDGVFNEKPDASEVLPLVIQGIAGEATNESATGKRMQAQADGALTLGVGASEVVARPNIEALVRESTSGLQALAQQVTKAEGDAKSIKEAQNLHEKKMRARDFLTMTQEEVETLASAEEKARLSWDAAAGKSADFTDNELNPALSATDEASANVINCDRSLAKHAWELKVQKDKHLKLINEFDSLESLECCPFCKSSGAKWKSKTLETLVPAIEASAAELRNYQSAFDAANETLSAATYERDTLATASRSLASESIPLSNAARAEQVAYSTAREATREARTELARGETIRSEAASSVAPVIAPDQADLISVAREKLNKAQADHDLLVAEQRVAAGQRAKEGARKEALAAAASSAVRLEVIKAAGKLMAEHQKTAIARTVGTFISKATELTAGLLPAALEYHDGEIGCFRDGCWVGISDFSGGEQLLAYGALSSALAMDSPCRVIIFDEMGTIDPEMKRGLIERMRDLIRKGLVDQVIGFDVSSTDYPVESAWGDDMQVKKL